MNGITIKWKPGQGQEYVFIRLHNSTNLFLKLKKKHTWWGLCPVCKDWKSLDFIIREIQRILWY